MDKEIYKWIKKRNHSVVFKSPLICDYDNTSRESLLSQQIDIPDLRGFMNGLILFGIVIYGNNLIDHFRRNGAFFSDQAISILKSSLNPYSFLLFVLFFLFWTTIYYFQKMGLKN